MSRIIVICLLLFGFLFESGFSQENNNQRNNKFGIIKGQVLEIESHKPLSFAQVSVFNVKNDKLVDGAISDKEGNFIINNLPEGKYYLMIKFIGYEKKKVNSIEITNDNPVFDLEKIELAFSNYETDGVEVTAEKPLVEFKMDKKVVNVNRDLISQGGSAVDALQSVPSVNVDVEGNVTLRGSSNFTVFINGKPSVLTGSDALEQIPAATIETIEIITNPSAKNDPDGVGGIINIVLKKDAELGLTGILDISAGTGDKYSSNALLNYQMKGFRVFGGFDYRDDTRNNTGNTESIYYLDDGNRHIDSDLDGKRLRAGSTLKGGIGIDITDANSISLEGNWGGMEFARTHNSNLHQWFEETPIDSFYINKNIGTHNRDFYSLNLNFIHNFEKKGHQLSAMAFYSNSTGEGGDSQEDFITDSVWNIIQKSNNNIKSIEDEKSYDYRFKADYVLPLT
ncbi:MAG: carboxypeptidase-like regulatory domain-containing protein, partial [bacterium]